MLEFEAGRTCLWFAPDPVGTAAAATSPPSAVVFLHGVGERGRGGDELARAAAWGLPKLRGERRPPLADGVPFLVVAPQCPPDLTWCDEPALAALGRLLDRLAADGAADPARLVIAGFSMGGIGSYCAALRWPRRFAGLVSVCGLSTEPERLGDLVHLPQWVAWAEDDEIPRLTLGSRDIAARLGGRAPLQARPYRVGARDGVGAHPRTADAAFAEPELYEWVRALPPAAPQ